MAMNMSSVAEELNMCKEYVMEYTTIEKNSVFLFCFVSEC